MQAGIATVVHLAGLSAESLVGLIVNAAHTARMHSDNCREFAQHVKMVGNLLEQLKISKLKKNLETREPLEQLEDALRRAYLLMNSCQERSYLYLMAMGWSIVNQFRCLQDEIDRYLRILTLLAVLDNSRAEGKLEEIEKDKREYTLSEEDRKAQLAIARNDTISLKKSMSFSYPNLPFEKALKKEHEKLTAELENSQANLDISQCQVIERLIEITEDAVNSESEKGSPCKSPLKLEQVKDNFSSEKSLSKVEKVKCSRAIPISSDHTHEMASTEEELWKEDWHADLLGCCSEPCLCIKTFLFPCGTLSKIASAATGEEISSGEACNEVMAYSLILSCCCYTCCIRRKLRRALNIKGGLVDDCLSHFMCCCCALVQEWREVEIRGLQETWTKAPSNQQMK